MTDERPLSKVLVLRGRHWTSTPSSYFTSTSEQEESEAKFIPV